jgi:serine/threonine-protein kinase
MIGKTISHYRITDKLGEGGMGVVYKAEDTKLKRTVALKFLAPELTREPTAKARFLHEAQAAAALHHANICTVYEIDETSDHLFIAMVYIEGLSLKEKIQNGPLELTEAVDVAIQVAEGLGEAHEHDIVHRDIKPANIMLTTGGQAQIMDFGLARSPCQTKLTRTDSSLGTCAYMSPEQSHGDKIDHRTDIWSFGVMLYEMISGCQPFRGDYEQAVVFALLSHDPEPLTGLRTGVPLELERIVGKTMAKDRENRYQHADDLLVDLRAVQERLQTETHPTDTAIRTRSSAATTAPGSRRPMAIVGGVLATVLILGALLVGLNVGNLRGRLLGKENMSPIRSLAVLPLDNMMGDAEQDFFVEGLHEALITELSKIGTLRVISRTSAMHFQATDKSIPEIARELDVDALVEGSVLRVGDQVRITAQLIHGATDEHLWADDYDRDLRDILSLLSEVARAIAGQIDIALTPGQQRRLTTERPVDPDVYETLLRGRHHLNEFTLDGAMEARRYFKQVVEADPNFSLGHAYLAGSYIVLGIMGTIPPGEIMPPARKAASRALELDPDLANAHTVLGFVQLYFDWDYPAAEREFRRALELDPNESHALHGIANCLIARGQLDEAVEWVRRSRQLDPYSRLRNMVYIAFLMLARRYEETIAEIEWWRSFSSDDRAGWFSLCMAYNRQGRYDEAMVELRNSSAGRDPEWAPALEETFATSGIRGAFRVCADRLAARSQHQYVDALDVAVYFALAADVEQTFEWLEKANQNRSPAMLHMIMGPAFDPYRSDPEFQDLMLKMGLAADPIVRE